MQGGVQFELLEPPSDGVSSIRFARHADLLLVTSWDCSVRLYDAALNTCRASFKQRMPVLDAAFLVCSALAPAKARSCRLAQDTDAAVSGGLDKLVRVHYLTSTAEEARVR
jgi:cell cycle arrest protein BUB3